MQRSQWSAAPRPSSSSLGGGRIVAASSRLPGRKFIAAHRCFSSERPEHRHRTANRSPRGGHRFCAGRLLRRRGDRDDDRTRRTYIPRPDETTVAVVDRRVRFTTTESLSPSGLQHRPRSGPAHKSGLGRPLAAGNGAGPTVQRRTAAPSCPEPGGSTRGRSNIDGGRHPAGAAQDARSWTRSHNR